MVEKERQKIAKYDRGIIELKGSEVNDVSCRN